MWERYIKFFNLRNNLNCLNLIIIMKKKGGLMEGSKNYSKKTHYYDLFSQAEDYPKKTFKFLDKKVKGKIVVDVGCGNGRYSKILAPKTKEYIGIDSSKQQITLAKRKTKTIKKASYIISPAESIPLKNNLADVVISTWTVSAIKGFTRKAKALKEMGRILKKGGEIYLVENAPEGEFQEIREATEWTKRYEQWLKKKEFKKTKEIDTYFKFDSLRLAKKVFWFIWGDRISNRIKSNRINQKIIIFKRKKK